MPRPNAISLRFRELEKLAGQIIYRPWFSGKEFSTNWSTGHFIMWRRILSPLRDKPLRILEIGSWEGRSALFFLNFFQHATILCIDTFAGGDDQKDDFLKPQLPLIEGRFDRNLVAFKSRLEKRKGHSATMLEQLAQEGRQFDLAYIDGSHVRDDVAADTAGVWKLLPRGAIIIWDDYGWRKDLPPEQRPQPAIDAFLNAHQGEYRLLARNYQVAIEKLV